MSTFEKRDYPRTGILPACTDVEWAVPHPPLMFSENCVHQRRRRDCRDGLHAQQKK